MINFAESKVYSVTLPEGKAKSINRKSDGLLLWKAAMKNWVPYSIESDGTIYNGGLGYIEGYRLSSSGALKEQENSVATGFIPAKPGDVIRMKGVTWGTTVDNGYSYIVFCNDNFERLTTVNKFEMDDTNNGVSNVGSTTIVDKSASTVLTDESGVTVFNIVFKTTLNFAYIRISATGSGSDMIVTVNDEITV